MQVHSLRLNKHRFKDGWLIKNMRTRVSQHVYLHKGEGQSCVRYITDFFTYIHKGKHNDKEINRD